MQDNTASQTPARSGPSRRAVLVAAAWSVPVIVVANAAPALAGTGQIVQFGGVACKWPGNSNKNNPKSYQFTMTSTNSYGFDMLVVITGFTVNGVAATYVTLEPNLYLEGTNACGAASSAMRQSDGTTLATFVVLDTTSITWLAIAGQYGDSENAEAVINYRTYMYPSCEPVDSKGYATSGRLNTPPCA